MPSERHIALTAQDQLLRWVATIISTFIKVLIVDLADSFQEPVPVGGAHTAINLNNLLLARASLATATISCLHQYNFFVRGQIRIATRTNQLLIKLTHAPSYTTLHKHFAGVFIGWRTLTKLMKFISSICIFSIIEIHGTVFIFTTFTS